MQNRVLKNASWIVGCKIAQSLINLVISMICARYLGPSNYGLLSYAGSVISFVLPIMQLGLSKTLVQELVEVPDQEGRILGTALVLNIVSALCCMLGVFGFLSIAHPDEPETVLIGVLYSISLLFQATEMIQYWFQAKLLSKYPSLAALGAYLIVALYKIYLLVTHKGIIWFAVSNSIDYMLISLSLIVIYLRMGKQKFSFSGHLAYKMLSRSKHYIVSSMMVTIFAQTDRIMLKLMLNETETGYYSAAVNCVSVTAFVFVAIIDSMRPSILEAKHSGAPDYEDKMILLYSIITYLSLAQSILMTVLAWPLVYCLYGVEYLSSTSALRIVVWYTTFSNYGSVRNIWILAEGKQKYLWIINLSGAAINVVLNAVLIPVLASVGAAVASLITQLFSNVIIGYLIRPIHHNNRLMMKGLDPRPLMIHVGTLIQGLKRKE